VPQALDLASQGPETVGPLVSSGDSGIYGKWPGLGPWNCAAARGRQQTGPSALHPGLSALQLGAARVGAPLMHDFCTISFSVSASRPWIDREAPAGCGLGRFCGGSLQPRFARATGSWPGPWSCWPRGGNHRQFPWCWPANWGRQEEQVKLLHRLATSPRQVSTCSAPVLVATAHPAADGGS